MSGWLVALAQQAGRGKRNAPGVARFLVDVDRQCQRLALELQTRAYRPGVGQTSSIADPKPRRIYALPFRDRINALERLGLKDEARAEVARLLWKNGSDVFLNLKAQELLVPDTRSIIPSVLYRKRKALETSGAALAAHAPAGEKLSLIAGGSFFRRGTINDMNRPL